MKMLILMLALTIMGCSSTPYIKAGIGYKIHGSVTNYKPCDNNIIGRIEAGFLLDSYTIGISHKSQLFCGRPFNDLNEIIIDQVFIDKTWTF